MIKGDPRFGVKSFIDNIKIVEEDEEEAEEENPSFEQTVERHFADTKENPAVLKLEQALQRDRLSIEKEARTKNRIDTDRELRLLKQDLKSGLSTEKRPTKKKNLMHGHKTQWKAGLGYSSQINAMVRRFLTFKRLN